MDDEALVGRLAADLDGCFEALVLAHQDRLYTIGLRMLGDTRDAEEVSQDAFVRAYRALAGYERDRIRELRLRPWLATIVINLARNRRRRLADRQPAIPMAHLMDAGLEPAEDPSRAPETVGLRRAETETWAVRLLACPPALRAAVILRHVDGLSYEEIAGALDRPIGTVKAQVHRGLANLRAQLLAERTVTLHEELTA